jgi:hypothetical protein
VRSRRTIAYRSNPPTPSSQADIKKGELMLHSAEATPVDGGKLRASGRISTKPNALYDPDALDVEGTAVGSRLSQVGEATGARTRAPMAG